MLRTHRLPSASLRETRLVRVLMPAAARDILILNDGQNVFSLPRTIGSRVKWRADETAEDGAPALAIGAVDNSPRRARDSLPDPDPTPQSVGRPAVGRHVRVAPADVLPAA